MSAISILLKDTTREFNVNKAIHYKLFKLRINYDEESHAGLNLGTTARFVTCGMSQVRGALAQISFDLWRLPLNTFFCSLYIPVFLSSLQSD